MRFKLLFLIFLLSISIVSAEKNVELNENLIENNQFITHEGENTIIDGYNYKTIINFKELNETFNVLEIKINNKNKPSGELIIGEKIKNQTYYLGTIAGDIKKHISKSELKILPINKKQGIYYSFSKNNPNGLKSNELILSIKKNEKEKYKYVTIETKGGVYNQNDYILTCEDCKLTLNQKTKSVQVEGEADLMKKEIYIKKYKNSNEEERKKLGVEKVIKIKDIKRLSLLKGDYKFNDKYNQKRVNDELDFKISAYPYTTDSWIGELKLRSFGGLITIGIIDPSEKYSIKEPTYLIRGMELSIFDIPENFISHIELTKYKPEHQIHIFDNNQALFTLDKGMLAFKKNVRSDVKCATKELNDFNCIDLNPTDKEIFIELKSTSNLFSPLKNKKIETINDPKIIFYKNWNYNNLKINPIANQGKIELSSEFINLFNTKKIKFNQSKYTITTGSNWYDLETSFTTYTRNNQNNFDKIQCYLNSKKCFLNGKEISKITNLKICQDDKNCPSGQTCIDNKCHQQVSYKEFIKGSSQKPKKIIFVGDNIEEKELKKIINDILYRDQIHNKGLFKLEPYASNSDLFGIFYLTTNEFSYSTKGPITGPIKGPIINQNILSQLTGLDYIVILSKHKFMSHNMWGSDPSISKISITNFAPLSTSDHSTVIHELAGHAIGHLADEYLESETGSKGQTYFRENCIFSHGNVQSHTMGFAFKEWSKLLGSTKASALVDEAVKNNWWGCGGSCDPKYCANNLKQASDSIMGSHKGEYAIYWGPVSEAIIKERLKRFRGEK